MIYLGDNWPDRYRGGVFMCNLHGNRINHDILERNGSTYVARHGKDFMLANDPWFRGIALTYGPDGGVYVSDWTDTGECHNYKVVDRTNGRIFKITYGDVKPWKGDLAKLSDLELAKLLEHKNEWMARHARRLLQENAQKRKLSAEAVDLLEKTLDFGARSERLHALWTLHAAEQLREKRLESLFTDPEEHIRAWAIRIAMEPFEGGKWVAKGKMPKWLLYRHIIAAERDHSSLVRLHIASTAQRLHPDRRRLVLSPLMGHPEDARDPYLPLMYWYATELQVSDAWSFRNLASHGGAPGDRLRYGSLVGQFAARRVAEIEAGGPAFDDLISCLADYDDPIFHQRCLRGIAEGLSGRRKVPMPDAWGKAFPILMESPLPEVRAHALALAVQFGDERAFTLLRKIVPDRALAVKQREDALKTLLFQQKPDLVPILHDLLSDEALRGPAIRGLAAFDDAKTPRLLLELYPRLNTDEKADAIQTLASRGPYALALLDAIAAKTIPRGDINSYTIRQLQTLKQPELAAKIAKVWGEVRPASADKAKLMAKYKAELTPALLKKANLANGRVLYAKSCANCHRLFGEGGDIGPDLTGSQRTNLDYVLENVLDPSAIVPKEYQVTIVVTTAGRTLSGIVKKESDAAITLQLPNEVVVLPKGEIESREATKLSMMPDGIFEPMRLEEVRDLVAFLASPMQVPLKK
jgi:putative heme-binding domain-containing protein